MVDENPRYVRKLREAKRCELAGDKAKAARLLRAAARMTHDEDERVHIDVWVSRLEKQAAPAAKEE